MHIVCDSVLVVYIKPHAIFKRVFLINGFPITKEEARSQAKFLEYCDCMDAYS